MFWFGGVGGVGGGGRVAQYIYPETRKILTKIQTPLSGGMTPPGNV